MRFGRMLVALMVVNVASAAMAVNREGQYKIPNDSFSGGYANGGVEIITVRGNASSIGGARILPSSNPDSLGSMQTARTWSAKSYRKLSTLTARKATWILPQLSRDYVDKLNRVLGKKNPSRVELESLKKVFQEAETELAEALKKLKSKDSCDGLGKSLIIAKNLSKLPVLTIRHRSDNAEQVRRRIVANLKAMEAALNAAFLRLCDLS